jgi:hypothetical protein
MRGESRVRKNTNPGRHLTDEDLSPIFFCPLCPGPVYTPYMEHYFKFHPDFPEVTISRMDDKSNRAVIEPPSHNTNKNTSSDKRR